MARLSQPPESDVASLTELAGIAASIERESAERYAWLAAEMRRRGEADTAEAFERLRDEERRHMVEVDAWAAGLGEAPAAAAPFRWRLPAELADSWEEAARSPALTPYRAYAVAADNEERAFAFFAYLAAMASDPRIAEQAERLAQEELRHAARVRVWRRAAWRREYRNEAAPPLPAASTAELEALIATREAGIAACHDAIAGRLADLDADEAASLLRETAALARARAGNVAAVGAAAVAGDSARSLLAEAQRPLERLCELLERTILAPPDEPTQSLALAAMEHAVAREARIGRLLDGLTED